MLCGSCNIINPDEPQPTIIHLHPFTFQSEPGQGTANNKITEAWVYANENFLGAFAPPVDIHYLEEGPTTFTFRPGIRNNGLADAAQVYPMFEGYSVDFNAMPGSELEVNPVTRYKSNVQFSFLSDFELTNDFVDNRDTFTTTSLVRSQQDVFEGNYSGQIIMTPVGRYIEVAHSIALSDLPANGKSSFLEFRYKNETDLYVGLVGIDLNGNSFSNFFYRANPTDEWNMLYIELTDRIQESALPAYKIVFSALYPSAATAPQLNIFLDNIKVVHL